MKNPMYHLVCNEEGVSALLATALDPTICEAAHPLQQSLWRHLADLLDLGLVADSPSLVEVEFPKSGDATTDILVLWDDWAIHVEDKIKKASVRRDQLERSYPRFRRGMDCEPELKDVRRLAMVLLSPDTIGLSHIERLEVLDDDAKVKLSWADIVDGLETAFAPEALVPDGAEFFVAMIRSGIEQLRDTLEAQLKPNPRNTENYTPNRERCREFLKSVKRMIGQRDTSIKVRGVWPDRTGDILSGSTGVKRTSDWNLTVDAVSDRSTVDEDGKADLGLVLVTKVVNNAPAALKRLGRDTVGAVVGNEPSLAKELGLPDAKIEVEVNAAKVVAAFSLQGESEAVATQLANAIVALVKRFSHLYVLPED